MWRGRPREGRKASGPSRVPSQFFRPAAAALLVLLLLSGPALAQVVDRGIFLYNRTNSQYIRYSTLNPTSGWSTDANFAVGSDPSGWRVDYSRAASSPGRSDVLIGLQKAAAAAVSAVPATGNHSVFIWNASTNTTSYFLDLEGTASTTLISGRSRRTFDVAFESQSGEGLVVFNATNVTAESQTRAEYRVWTPGVGWGAQGQLPLQASGGASRVIRQIALASNPARNEVLALVGDGGATPNNLNLFLWNGTAWTNFSSNPIGPNYNVCGTAACNSIGNKTFDAVYDSTGEKAVIAYALQGGSNVLYRIWYPWNQTMSAELTGPAVASPNQVRLASDPASNRVVLGAVQGTSSATQDDAYFAVWDGEQWDPLFKPADRLRAANTGRRSFDVAFDGRNRAAILMGLASQTNVWQNWWFAGNESNNTNSTLPIPSGQSAGEFLSAAGSPNASSGEILLLDRDANGDPSGWRWDPPSELWANGLELSTTPTTYAWSGEPEAVAWTIMAQPVIELHATSSGSDFINWSWRNPAWGFNSSQVFLDGASVSWTGTPGNLSYYNATGLGAGTKHNLTVRATNLSGGAAVNASSTGFTAPSSGVLLYDDFEAGGGQWTTSGGTWKNATGTFQTNVSGAASGTALRGDGAWTGYEVTFSSKTLQKGNNPWETARFLFRYSNSSNYFALIPHYNSTNLEIAQMFGGVWYGNRAVTYPAKFGQDWHAYTIRVTDNTSNATQVDINISVDGMTYINYTESGQPIANGSVGLYLDTGGASFSSLAQWDDVRVVDLSAPPPPPSEPLFYNSSWNRSSVSLNTPVRFNVTVESTTTVTQARINVTYPNGTTAQRSLANTSVSLGGNRFNWSYNETSTSATGTYTAVNVSALNSSKWNVSELSGVQFTVFQPPIFSNTSWNQSSVSPNAPVRFNVTVESTTTVTQASLNVTYPNGTTVQRSLANTSQCVDGNPGNCQGGYSPSLDSGDWQCSGAEWAFACGGTEGANDNTKDGCTNHGSNEGFEAVNEVVVSDKVVAPGGTITFTGYTNWGGDVQQQERMFLYYPSNSTWVQVDYWGSAGATANDTRTVTASAPSTPGTYTLRMGLTFSITADTDGCMDVDATYADNDDVNFTVSAYTAPATKYNWSYNETSTSATGTYTAVNVSALNSSGWNASTLSGVTFTVLDTTPPQAGVANVPGSEFNQTSAAIGSDGSIRDWVILGSFPDNVGACGNYTGTTGLNASEAAAEQAWPDKSEAGNTWTRNNDFNDWTIDLDTQVSPNDYVHAYAFTKIFSPTTKNVNLLLGSDDGVVAWLNGVKVWNNSAACRAVGQDQDNVTVTLKPGWNRLLLLVTENTGGFAFTARFNESGSPLTPSNGGIATSLNDGTVAGGWNTTSQAINVSCLDNSGGGGCNTTSGEQMLYIRVGTPGDIGNPGNCPTSFSSYTNASGEVVTGYRLACAAARDVAGNAGLTYTEVELWVDTTPPQGGSVSYPDGYRTTTSVDVAFSNGTDNDSGVSFNEIRSRAAGLSGGTCGSFGAWATNATSPPGSPYTATGLASGQCYQFSQNVTDSAGLSAGFTSASVVKVDTSAPTGGSVSYPNGENEPDSAAVSFNNGTDAQSGMDGVSIYRRETARSGPGACNAFASNWTLRVSNYSTSPWTDTGLADNTCYQWSHNTSNGAGLWTNYTSGNTYINIPPQTAIFSNTSWNQSLVNPNAPVRFNATVESTTTVTQARINVTYPNGTTAQRSLTNTSVSLGGNRYNWSYNETSTSATGTYTAVNVSALNSSGWNSSTLSGVEFAVAPPGSNFLPGDTVQAHDTGGTLNVRGPNACDSVIATESDGANGTVTADSPVVCNFGGTDYTMWRVVWEDGAVGWSADNWLRGKVRGLDVYSGQGTINWTRVFNAGYRFAFVKATEGATFDDSKFTTNMANGTNAGLAMGAYHFARPDNNDPETEASHFLDIAKPYLGRGRLRPVLDMETVGTTGAGSMSEWVNRWMYAVRNSTGADPLLYTSPSFSNSNYVSNVTQWEVWIAAWPACRCPDDSPSSTSYWSDWAFWQFSESGSVPGISGNVDLNVFNGGLSRLRNYVNRTPDLTGAAWNQSSASPGQPVLLNVTVGGQGNVSEARTNVSYPNGSTLQRSLARAASANDSWFSGSGPGFQEGVRYAIRNSTESGGPSYFFFNASAGNFTLTNISSLLYTGAGTGTPAGNDGCTQAPVPIGFPFKFFGAAYTAAHVCNDGRLQFINNTTGLSGNAAVPTGTSPDGYIAPYWDDLCIGTGGGGIFNATIGAAPDRIFVVRWELANWSGSGCLSETDKYNFMAVLYENSSDIQFNYADTTSNPSSRNNCASATVGIENQSGDSGIQHSYNTASSCSAGYAARFYYPNRYTHVETSTSTAGTYGAVNLSARNEFNTWNVSVLSGVQFTVTVPVRLGFNNGDFEATSDAANWTYSENGAPYTGQFNYPGGAFPSANYNVSPVASYNLSFPWSTGGGAGWFGALNQTINVTAGSPKWLNFWVRDDFTGGTCNYHIKRLVVNDTVQWSNDTCGTGGDTGPDNWRNVSVNVTSGFPSASALRVSLQAYQQAAVFNFGITTQWDEVFYGTGAAVNITDAQPASPASDNAGAARSFNVTANDVTNVRWYLNNTLVQTNTSVSSGARAYYNNSSAVAGNWRVRALANNSSGTDMEVWGWSVTGGGPPTGTSITYAAGNNTTATYWVGFDNGTGATWNNLTTQQASYSGGACGAYSPVAPWTLNYSNVPSPVTSFSLTDARCFRIAINASNSNGWNNASGGEVRVDTTPPTIGGSAPANNSWQTANFAVSPTDSDPESGVQTCYYAVLNNGPETVNTTRTCSSPVTITVGAGQQCSVGGGDGSTTGPCQVRAWARNWHNSNSTVFARNYSIDYTAPTGGSISYTDGFITTTSTSVTFTNASDPESGVSANYVDRRQTTMGNGVCNSFGSNWTNLTTNVTSPYSATGLSSGQCYQFKLITRNGALTNSSDITSASVVRVDTSAPTGSSISYTAGNYTTASVSITFTNGSDPESGINGNNLTSQQAAYSAGACGAYSPTGTPWSLNASNVPSPQSITTTQARCLRFALNVSNRANSWDNTSIGSVVRVDTSAPTGGSISYVDGYDTDGTVSVTFTNPSDAESGLEGNYIDRRQTALGGGTCNSFGSNWTNLTTNATSPYSATGLSSGQCYQFKLITRNGALTNSSDITSASVARVDTSAPTGTSISYATGYNTTGSVSVSFGNGTDAESSISGNNLTSQQATLSAGSCGAYSPVAPWSTNGSNVASPQALSVTSGKCFRFAINVTNGAGLWTNVSGSAVQVDTTAPSGGSVSYPNGENEPDSAAVTFNNGTDSESGMDGVSIYRRETARSGPGACNGFANNWTLRVSNYSTSPWTDTGLADNTCYQWSHNTSNGAGLWTNYTSGNTYIDIAASGPNFYNASWNKTNANLNDPVRFNVTIESTATVTSARINVTYPNSTTLQRSLANTSLQVGPNRYNWSYNETSTSATGTYTAVNVSATNGTWNTSTLSGVSFTVGDTTPPVISGLSAKIDDLGGYLELHVNWTTDETADGLAMIGRDPSLLAPRNWTNASLVTSHNTTLQDGPGTADDPFDDVDYGAVIYYQVRSKDGSGNAAWSSVQSITSPACSGSGGGIATNINGKVFNSTDIFNATFPNANVSATNKGFARALEITDNIVGDSRSPPNQQMFDGRFFWDAGTQWGGGWAKCERAAVLTEVNRTTSLNNANYTAVTHRNLSTNNPIIFDASILEKIPDLSAAAGPSTGSDGYVNLTFTSQKDPNQGVVNYSLYRSPDNVTYTRIANITAVPNTALSYNDTGLAYGDKFYRLKVTALGNIESEGFGNVTSAHVADASPPSGTSISYATGYNTTGSVSVSFSNGTDGETGISGNNLTSQQATLSAGSCGAYSPVAPWSTNGSNVASPRTLSVTSGKCFRFALNVTNGEGYWSNVSDGVLMVDTTAPTGGSLSYFNGINDTKTVVITLTNASDPESGVGTNFLDIRETAYNNGTDACNSFGSNWTNSTSGIASGYTVTGLETQKCYSFKMRTQNGAGTNSSDITSASVVKVIGVTVTITSPSAGATLGYAEVPVNVTSSQAIVTIQARINSDDWTNLTPQCAGSTTCNATFILNRNAAYTLDVFANSTIDPIGQTSSRAFTLAVPGTPTVAAQETARELTSGGMAVSSGGQLKWKLTMNDSNVSTTHGKGGAGALLALADAYAAVGGSSILNAVNNSSNWLVATTASRTGTTGRWWMQFESPGAAAVRSDLPGGSLGPVYGLLRAYELNGNGSHWNAAKEGLAWLLNNTSVAYNASGSPYPGGAANLSFCLTPTSAACSSSAQRATSMTGAAGAIEVLIEATNASGNATYLGAARSAANWLISQAVAAGADQNKWPRALPPPGDGPEYLPGVQEGTAGVVQAFLDLYFATGNATYLDQAVKGGNWLADLQTSDGAWLLIDQGTTCSTASSPGTPCLTGYDYGAAGILDVLLSLYNATRDNSTYASSADSFKSAAQSAVAWLTQTGSGKAAEDVDGSGSIDGSGELRWRYEPATDRFYTGDSEEAGGSASVVRALAGAYGAFGSDSYRLAAEEGIRRLKNPQACMSADGDFLSTGAGSLRCRDRDSGSEFTSGRNGTAGVLGAMSRIERAIKVTITVPDASTRGYPSSGQANIPVLVRFNVSKLLSDAPVAGLASGDVRVLQDGAQVTPINFTGNATGGDYSLNVSASPAKGSHTLFVRVKAGPVKAASPDATYTVGSTHSASTSTNRSSVAPGEQFSYTVTVTGTAEVWTQVWVNTTVPSDATLVSPASPNQSVNVTTGSAQVTYILQAATNAAHVLSSTVANGTGQNATTVTVSATVSAVGGPSITTISNNATGDASTSVTIAPGTNVSFSAAADQTGNWTWLVDGSFVKPEQNTASSSYARLFTSSGTYSVTVNVSNVNGTSATTTWTVTAVGTPGITAISNNATGGSSTDISVTAGTTVQFQATGNQSGNWTWRANTTVVKWQVGGTTSTNNTTYSSTGNFNMSVNLSNANGTGTTKVWNITVNPLPAQTPSLAIELVQVNKSTSSDCPTTPCVATGEDFNLSVRVKNNGAAVSPSVYVNRTAQSSITWLNSSGTRPVQQTTLLPNAAGDLSQWGVTGAASNYAAVDDDVSDSDTTYVSTTTQNNRDLYNLGDLPDDAATVPNVTVIVQARKADSNPVNFNVNLRNSTGGNVFEADTALGNTYANYTYVYSTSPFTSQPWTVAEVNGLQAGVQHKQLEVREARVTAVWVRVNYTESDSILLGNLSPGQSAWANWTLEFNSGPNQSYTLAVTAQDNISSLSDSTSVCLVLCSPVTLTLTPSTNRTGDAVGLNGYINVTVAVKNAHDTRTVSNANVTVNPPAGLVFTANDSGGSGNWSVISSLAPGASASRNFTFRAGAYGSYSVNARATSPTIGSDTFTGSQSVTVAGPTLALSPAPSFNRTPAKVASGQPFNLTVTVANSGQTAATSVTTNVVLDACPAGATLVSGTANRSVGNLSAGGGSNSTNYTYQLNSGNSDCTFKVYANNTTQVASGDTASATTSAIESKVLKLVSSGVNLSDVAVGQVFRLDVSVSNDQTCPACAGATLSGVWTNVTLPSGLRLSNGSNTSNVGTLAAGASNTSMFYIVADVAGTYSGAGGISVSTTSGNGGSASGTADSVTARGPTLQVSAVVPGTVATNTTFNYTLVLENTGAGNVNNLTYNVTLPAGVSYAGGDAMNGTVKSGTSSAGVLNGTYVTGGATGENVSYTLRLNITGAPGATYTLRGYGNGSNANGSVLILVKAQSLASGWTLSGLPASASAGTPVQLNIRVMNGSNPVSGAVVNVTEYNGVGLFAAPTQARSTKTVVTGTTGASGYANLTVVPAPSTLAGYSLRVVASGSSNSSPESVLAVGTTPDSRGSGAPFSGEDYWSLFTSLPGEIAAAVSKVNYLTGAAASAPAYGGSEATVTLSGVSTTVNVTPSTVDNKVPTTVAVRTTQGSPKANLTVRVVETSGHSLLAGAGQSNGTSEISDVTDASGYANLTIAPTRSPWSTWLQAKGSAAFDISVYVSDGSEEKLVMGLTVTSATPASAYVQDSGALTGALAREILLLKNKMEWVVP